VYYVITMMRIVSIYFLHVQVAWMFRVWVIVFSLSLLLLWFSSCFIVSHMMSLLHLLLASILWSIWKQRK
jgi:hypothetical protein